MDFTAECSAGNREFTMHRILIVDNDDNILMLLMDFLILKGFYVRTADNGQKAIEILKTEPFDIIITDYDMPGINGVELTNIIRSMNLNSLIIGISADSKEQDFLKAGADLFISKPFSISDLNNSIDRLLKK
jgi:DNA-binding response OmpR family regulator